MWPGLIRDIFSTQKYTLQSLLSRWHDSPKCYSCASHEQHNYINTQGRHPSTIPFLFFLSLTILLRNLVFKVIINDLKVRLFFFSVNDYKNITVVLSFTVIFHT